jgi:hypothetical protein
MTKSPFEKVSYRAKFLQQVEELICNERNKSYGEPYKNMDTTAKIMQAYLGNRTGDSIAASDVAIFGVILKLGRLAKDPEHLDSLLDIAGYIAIAYECVMKKIEEGSGDAEASPDN